MTTVIFSGLVVLSVAGCTVNRELAPQSISPPASLGNERLPLNVAVIGDPALKFDYPRYFKAFVEVLNPGLAQTLQSAFRGNFQNVNVVEAEEAAGSADLLASPKLELSDPMKLTVTFVDPRSQRIVAELSSERSCDGNAPGVYDHLVTDLVLFAAVVVFPLRTSWSRMKSTSTLPIASTPHLRPRSRRWPAISRSRRRRILTYSRSRHRAFNPLAPHP